MPGADFAEIRNFFVPKKKNLPCSEIGKVLVKKTQISNAVLIEKKERQNYKKMKILRRNFTLCLGSQLFQETCGRVSQFVYFFLS